MGRSGDNPTKRVATVRATRMRVCDGESPAGVGLNAAGSPRFGKRERFPTRAFSRPYAQASSPLPCERRVLLPCAGELGPSSPMSAASSSGSLPLPAYVQVSSPPPPPAPSLRRPQVSSPPPVRAPPPPVWALPHVQVTSPPPPPAPSLHRLPDLHLPVGSLPPPDLRAPVSVLKKDRDVDRNSYMGPVARL